MTLHDKAVKEAARKDIGGNPPLVLIADVDIKVRAYLSAMAAAGWKLTPRKATDEMWAAGAVYDAGPSAVWSAMHDAAPSPEDAE